jgi:hypothetical protein
MLKLEFLEEARKEITLAVFEGSKDAATAAVELNGLLTLVAVAQHDSKSDKLKTELVNVRAALENTIAKLTAE